MEKDKIHKLKTFFVSTSTKLEGAPSPISFRKISPPRMRQKRLSLNASFGSRAGAPRSAEGARPRTSAPPKSRSPTERTRSPPSASGRLAHPHTFLDPVHTFRRPVRLVRKKNLGVKLICCGLCKRPFSELVSLPCSHSLCPTCYADLGNDACPCCDRKFNPAELKPDLRVRKRLQGAVIHCPFAKEGCAWTGVFKDLAAHMRECKCNTIPCNNSHRGCTFRAASLEERRVHLAECPYNSTPCEHCGAYMFHLNLDAHHDVCPRAPLECEHCGAQLLREAMPRHLADDCQKIPVLCPLPGCAFVGPREELRPHILAHMGPHLLALSKAYQDNLIEIMNAERRSRADAYLFQSGMSFDDNVCKQNNITWGEIDPATLPTPETVVAKLVEAQGGFDACTGSFRRELAELQRAADSFVALMVSDDGRSVLRAVDLAQSTSEELDAAFAGLEALRAATDAGRVELEDYHRALHQQARRIGEIGRGEIAFDIVRECFDERLVAQLSGVAAETAQIAREQIAAHISSQACEVDATGAAIHIDSFEDVEATLDAFEAARERDVLEFGADLRRRVRELVEAPVDDDTPELQALLAGLRANADTLDGTLGPEGAVTEGFRRLKQASTEHKTTIASEVGPLVESIDAEVGSVFASLDRAFAAASSC